MASTDVGVDDAYRAAVVDLLGVLAYGELMAFERLAADAALAPTIDDEAQLAGMAAAEFRHFTRLRDRLVELGADPAQAMAPFRAPLESFHEMTAPSDWLEGLVKAYVGDGIGVDFYREIAEFLDPQTRALVLEVCEDRHLLSIGCALRSSRIRESRGGLHSGLVASWVKPSPKRSMWRPRGRR